LFVGLQGLFLGVGAANGTIKIDKLQDFLAMIQPYKKVNIDNTIEKMKEAGLPIEEK
jgi:hypothetical protein